MSRIEISVLSPQAALQAFADTWQQAETGERAGSRLAFGSLRELFSATTEKRLDLLRHVASHEGLNQKQEIPRLCRGTRKV
jgi:predicted transcriptional regulator